MSSTLTELPRFNLLIDKYIIPQDAFRTRRCFRKISDMSSGPLKDFHVTVLGARGLALTTPFLTTACAGGYFLRATGNLFMHLGQGEIKIALRKFLDDQLSGLQCLALTVLAAAYAVFGLFAGSWLFNRYVPTETKPEDIHSEYKNKNAALSQELKTKKTAYSALEKKAKENEKTHLASIKTLNTSNSKLTATVKLKEKEIADLKKKLTKAEQTKQKIVQTHKQSMQTHDKLKTEKQKVDKELADIKRENYKDRISRLEAEKKKLLQEIKEAGTKKKQEIEALQASLEDLQQKYSKSLETSDNALKDALKNLTDEMTKIKALEETAKKHMSLGESLYAILQKELNERTNVEPEISALLNNVRGSLTPAVVV